MDQPNGNLSIALFAEDLRALLEALGIEEACVLGHSMGGRREKVAKLRCYRRPQ